MDLANKRSEKRSVKEPIEEIQMVNKGNNTESESL